MTKIEIEMMRALAAYSGPVKRCRPGKARAADLPKKDDRAQQWLNAHRRDAPIRDDKARRRKLRMERAEQERIMKRNALVKKWKCLIGHGRTDVEPCRDDGLRSDTSLEEKLQNEHG
jgi:hypothetical protein